jgi:predicted O-methyltransferase YrrM
MNPVLEDVYRTGKCADLAGREREVTGAVPREDALSLQEMVRATRARTTCETGVAFGLSTLAICEALKENGGEDVRHYGVDPKQTELHGGSALASLKRAGLDSVFELLEGPSHLMLPRLLERGISLDLAFVDGWHTFDYTLLDVFFLDKLLRPGGILLLHDCSWPSKQKTIGYLLTHRRYRRLELPGRAPASSPVKRRLKAAYRGLRGAPPSLVKAEAEGLPDLAAFEKTESFEPDYRFFEDF